MRDLDRVRDRTYDRRMSPETRARVVSAALALLALAASALGYHEIATRVAPPACECLDDADASTDTE